METSGLGEGAKLSSRETSQASGCQGNLERRTAHSPGGQAAPAVSPGRGHLHGDQQGLNNECLQLHTPATAPQATCIHRAQHASHLQEMCFLYKEVPGKWN